MPVEDDLNAWIVTQGVTVNGIAAHRFPGRGMGIIATKILQAGDVALTVPTSFFRSVHSLDEDVTRRLDGCSMMAILAVGLVLEDEALDHHDRGEQDDAENGDREEAENIIHPSPSLSSSSLPSPLDSATKTTTSTPWHQILPSHNEILQTMPQTWPIELQSLLPTPAIELLSKQTKTLTRDWRIVRTHYPNFTYETFITKWFAVNTRTFYYTRPEDKPRDSDDCLALIPFADCFNHDASGDEPCCDVVFESTSTEYKFVLEGSVEVGEEMFIRYGNHSNDFLLVEYGFIAEGNKWDEISLDEVVLSLFGTEEKIALKDFGYLGEYVIDGDWVCYRTLVALRMLCMPAGKWEDVVACGFDEEDEYEDVVGGLVSKVLRSFMEIVRGRLDQIRSLKCGLQCQRDVLAKRWKQIHEVLEQAVESRIKRDSVVEGHVSQEGNSQNS